ncbi:unnamed protein product [Adineta steineri]|uniref:Tetratricopeptide repeat protein n=1 Tax=Adineta steineri TaxID=433720 RepID=A0A819T460_9BILA|nr:unnamed protein product [Adineta steineri]CAF4071622.1 unnamed protein product [Adineta steineri]
MLLVYRFRYWVKLLCSAIEREHQRQNNDQVWSLYSGFRLHKDELERLKQSVGNLISINSFLSTSRNINVAQIFAGTGPIESHLVRVILHIEANPTRLQSVFCADIHEISQFPEEEEVLFSLGSTFRILSMDFNEENQHWIFTLNATDDARDQIHKYCQLANYDFRMTTPMIYFGRILNENLDQTGHATKYFHELLRIIDRTHEDLPEIYDALGDTYFRRKEIAEAIKYYKIEQKIRRKRNIAPIEPDEKIRTKLLKELEEEDSRTDEPNLAKASLLCTLADYSKYIQAEIYLTRALHIYERLHVASPSMSKCIEDLAWKCRQNEKLQQSLELQYRRLATSEKYLPLDNQTLSDIFTDILNELTTPDNHRQFIRFCQRKLSILDEDGSLDEDHPRLIHIEDCLQKAQNQLKKFKEQQTKWLSELSLSINQNDPYQLSLLYQKISIFYFKNGLYNESISHLLNELEIYENILGYNPRIFEILYEIQRCYTYMLDYTQAFIYTQIAFKLAQLVEHICPGIVQDRQTRIDNFVRRVAKYQIELPWTPLTADNDPFF